MSVIYAKLINQYKVKLQTVISARFDKQDEDSQVLDKTELYININIKDNLTETDLDYINVRFALEKKLQKQEMKESGCRFAIIISKTIDFYKTGGLNDSIYVKIPLRSSVILNVQNDDKKCLLWLILAHLHPVADSKMVKIFKF